MVVTRFISLAKKELNIGWGRMYTFTVKHESKIFHFRSHNSTLRNLELCSTFFNFLEGLIQVLNMLLIILSSDD